jgi:DNA-binding CsgD family transcriptional regulator/tetratricopeptide (TPR) repeat protein
VVTVSSDEFLQRVPFAAFLLALPELSAVTPGTPELLLVQRIRSWLENLAAEEPVLVVLDDVHWADPGTVLVLRALPRELSHRRLAWIAARTAPGPAGAHIFDLLEREGAARIDLAPLASEKIGELLTEIIGQAPGSDLLELAAGASGNPALIIRLAEGLLEEDGLELSAGPATLISLRLPQRLQAEVRRRLAGLSDRARLVLDIAAILDPTFAPADTGEMLGDSVARLWPFLEESLGSGILVPSSDGLRFTHPLVRQSLVEAVPEPVRKALHLQAAEIMTRRGQPVSAANHLSAVAGTGDQRVVAKLDSAVWATLSSSPQDAAELALRALELTGAADPDRPGRILAVTSACIAAGQLDLAEAIARTSLDGPFPVVEAARLHCFRSRIHYLSGRAAEAVTEATVALADSPHDDGAELARLTGLAALSDPEPANERAAILLEDPGPWQDATLVTARSVLSAARRDQGRLTDALALAREAARQAAEGSLEARWCHPLLGLAALLIDVRSLDEAEAVLRAADDEVQVLGHLVWQSASVILHSRISLAEGRSGRAAAQADRGLRTADAQGAHLFSALALSVLGTTALRRGDLPSAEQYATDPRTAHSPLPATGARDRCLLIRAQIAQIRSGSQAALDLLAGLLDALPTRLGPLIGDPVTAPWLVRTTLAAGHPGSARTVVAAAETISRGGSGLPALGAAAMHARGILDGDARALARACAEHGDPWAVASAAEDLGGLLAESGRTRQAVARFEEAIHGFDGADAARDAGRVRSRLRKLGVRHRHWSAGSEERPASGWGSLTDTELTVSELVTEGLTNQQVADRLFLSPHTIAFHLRQIFRKLGIGSRVDLTRLLLERAGRTTRSEDAGPDQDGERQT